MAVVRRAESPILWLSAHSNIDGTCCNASQLLIGDRARRPKKKCDS